MALTECATDCVENQVEAVKLIVKALDMCVRSLNGASEAGKCSGYLLKA